ncbi:hypothetical protein VTJ49DRAFT_688 [Mycothermus thermophilus]|uniref:Alpha-1,3-mannosyltransferase CMT1 n=1 Tax=Humicola insolens TaxID=85995 RepID=A0ABR3VFH2_HUMIN
MKVNVLDPATKSTYIDAILAPEVTAVPRLECPKPDTSRYEHLRVTGADSEDGVITYFFALDLRQCVKLLPRLIGSIAETIRFLGPQNCALSIVEGNSDDGTGEVLAALRPSLEEVGVTYYLTTTPINPKEDDRIVALAQLRNLAIQPIIDQANNKTSSSPLAAGRRYSAHDTNIVFLNDVAICAEDILELIYQRRFLQADMVCAMDWTYVGPDPTFYDVWTARGMTGDSFFRIPPDGSWDFAWNLFWNDADIYQKLSAHTSFQVFSCWNGATVFGAGPVLDEGVRFRSARKGECLQGEPQLFWKKIKDAKGYTSRPPDMIKCIPTYDNQYFEPWNVTQPGG